jgi:AAA15 family ATPase/GTPase
MILKALKYSSPTWYIGSGTTNEDFVSFENINLIVGRNASGKTKTIQAIRRIADLFDSEISGSFIDFQDENTVFEIFFQDGNNKYQYYLECPNDSVIGTIVQEKLIVNEEVKLNRMEGRLFYEVEKRDLAFKNEGLQLVIARRDSIQQPFFDILHDWGHNLANYSFGSNMGRMKFSSYDKEYEDSINFKDGNEIRKVYRKGISQFEHSFEQTIINDMKVIDYDLKSIFLDTASKFLHIKVQESDLINETHFEHMSQGMARAFSLIVQLNYSLMAKIPSCILIDDIGEGLDYDRSKKLIELIIEKAEGSNIQVFMTTNDRFVMNSVPLKYWSVIHREGNKSVFYNYQNSKQTFDDFALTGFNNFDFFATEFYRLGFEEFIQTA